MPPKRKLANSTSVARKPRKRAKKTSSERAFVWKPRQWFVKEEVTDQVFVLASKENHKQLVVKKVMRIEKNIDKDYSPLEIRVLALLPDCNRISKPIFYSRSDDDPTTGTAIYTHYPLGDLEDWREERGAPVPESFIWRFFIQMSQALAVLQNVIEPRRAGQKTLIHRDIKPKNILVVENGTTYPSFKMHDFGCAFAYMEKKAAQPAFCGTFDWQPPENPIINTKAADVWGLGACVHYLATGEPPIDDIERYKSGRVEIGLGDPPSARNYTSKSRYYAAKAPRKVTPINGVGGYQYSDELNGWMEKCLSFEPSNRPTVENLISGMVEEAKPMLKMMGGHPALTDLEAIIGSRGADT
ncbi:kinase-like protein [Lentithecium fluviatile CBS 122367]|uniref:non-specific serine/threonine protein kinase n=1 Tax=Lentithecium fluviatile CBS 122367 TaxID=1168545 RepID=A0A6G1J665_9PLEO|nr:kinase-like protein [Lentithecium fluviatile CBS 122367]